MTFEVENPVPAAVYAPVGAIRTDSRAGRRSACAAPSRDLIAPSDASWSEASGRHTFHDDDSRCDCRSSPPIVIEVVQPLLHNRRPTIVALHKPAASAEIGRASCRE